MPSLKSRVKQEVLERAMGQCERCDGELGSSLYFHYKSYRVLLPDAVIVVCSKCHSEIQSKSGKIY